MAAGTHADHYGVLGIPSRSSTEEVKKAYRTLSKMYHPDKVGHLQEAEKADCERKMVALNVAYQVLMCPRQRREYDLIHVRPEPSVPTRSQSQSQRNTSYGGPSARPSARRTASSTPRAPTPDARCDQATPTPRTATSSSAPAAPQEEPPVSARGAAGPPPKPRYIHAAKYTQRSRQARRMDPSQYTVHVDGRSGEFVGAAQAAVDAAAPPEFFTGAGSGAPCSVPMPPGLPKNPTWLQRQMDIAKEWEQVYCAEPQTENYKWAKASDGWLRNLREKKEQRQAQASRDDHAGEDLFWPPLVSAVA
eukprot:gnl/TRDRNA2_/TRDRNA2_182053_c0_seq1.p1 gnl/TRDRNA2_/TRDRNA2_182053_c0~~gnl/TRDRNA2_/TRDRNA2_182053_c0_seq1.p1  ORF type:complete len:305 (-),score=54.92 gnl/TRDRNA2_/TRDRNA2_182053_c0_seq1:90-1004(-)